MSLFYVRGRPIPWVLVKPRYRLVAGALVLVQRLPFTSPSATLESNSTCGEQHVE